MNIYPSAPIMLGIAGGVIPVFDDAACSELVDIFDLGGAPLGGLPVGDDGVLTQFQCASTAPLYVRSADNVVVALYAAAAATVGGGSATFVGVSPANPVWLAPAAWFVLNLSVQATFGPVPSYTYDNGTGGVGATIASDAPGALVVYDGNGQVGSPTVGDRILFNDADMPYYNGVYTITVIGDDSTTWVLTRAGDNDTAETLGICWAVAIPPVGDEGEGSVAVAFFILDPFVVGESPLPLNFGVGSGTAVGSGCTASGIGSFAEGNSNVASGSGAHAEGDAENLALGDAAHVEGAGSIAAAPGSHAQGLQSLAYSNGQHAESSGSISHPGDSQFSRVTGNCQTADPTPLSTVLVTFVDQNGAPVWDRSMLVTIRCVARRTDTPGECSTWIAQGAIDGDGSGAYRWVGAGTSPDFTVVSQDAAAGSDGWAVSVTIFGNQLFLTFTGADGQMINWESTAEMDEVAG